MANHCSRCNNTIAPGSQFCSKCGMQFTNPVSSNPNTVQMKLNVNATKGTPHVYNKPQKLQNPSASKNQKAIIWLVVLVTFLIVGTVEDLTGGKGVGSDTASPSNSASTPASAPPNNSTQSNSGVATSDVFQIGDIGAIRTGTGSQGDTDYIATTVDAFNKMSDAAKAKDDVGFNQLLANGSSFAVSEGTHAKWLGDEPLLQIGLRHIRITDGPHAAEDGWIPREWLKKE